MRDRLRDPETLGLVGLRRSGAGWVGRCPWHEDSSPSFSVRDYPDGIGWTCFAGCGSGDVLSLVARMHGLDVRGRGFVEVIAIAERLAGIMPGETPRPIVERRASPPRTIIDAAEVAEVWSGCVPVVDDDQVVAWLRSRAIDPHVVALLDLARALPRDARLPRWAWCGGPWAATGHRLVVPTFDADGRLVSMQARAIVERRAKAVWPCRPTPETATAVGVFADPRGREMLAGTVDDVREVVLVEGIPDFLTVATVVAVASADPAPAVLGFAAGVWRQAIANRVPDAATVTIVRHPDVAGAKYTESIVESLGDRVDVEVVNG